MWFIVTVSRVINFAVFSFAILSGGVPPSRWVVNFDYDLLDGLVLAAVLAAHVPFLVSSQKCVFSFPVSQMYLCSYIICDPCYQN